MLIGSITGLKVEQHFLRLCHRSRDRGASERKSTRSSLKLDKSLSLFRLTARVISHRERHLAKYLSDEWSGFFFYSVPLPTESFDAYTSEFGSSWSRRTNERSTIRSFVDACASVTNRRFRGCHDSRTFANRPENEAKFVPRFRALPEPVLFFFLSNIRHTRSPPAVISILPPSRSSHTHLSKYISIALEPGELSWASRSVEIQPKRFTGTEIQTPKSRQHREILSCSSASTWY